MKIAATINFSCFGVVSKWICAASIGAASLFLSACDPTTEGGIDPGVIEIPIAYIRRPVLMDNNNNPPTPVQYDVREPRLFSEGGDVYLRTDSTAGATTINVSGSVTLGTGDVKHLNYSHDGEKLIFSLRLFDPNQNNPTEKWNIYEYEIETATLSQVMGNADAVLGDDMFPAYLPDGRIVFSSNRQKDAGQMRLAEGKANYVALDENENEDAMVLHVMSPDGSNIKQISFNHSHDLNPIVMDNLFPGQILFSRWDNASGNNEFNIYKMNPDGSEQEIVYGARSHNTGTNNSNIHFTGIREMDNGDLMAIARSFTNVFDGGDIVVIDADRFIDVNKPIWSQPGLSGPAHYSATLADVNTISNAISPEGRYNTAFPLAGGSSLVLVSRGICQVDILGEVLPCNSDNLNDPNAVETAPAYSIWLLNLSNGTEKPLITPETGMVITDAIALRVKPRPPVIFDKGPGQLISGWVNDTVGVVNIKSVYDFGDNDNTFNNGCFFTECVPPAAGVTSLADMEDPIAVPASDRPARFVRFVSPVGLQDPDTGGADLLDEAFGPQRNRGMREILGYAPVAPDGSVKVRVPAYTSMGVEVLDGEGRRIGPIHNNWFHVQPGDMLTCNGCHDTNNGGNPPEAHARSDAEAPSINAGLSFLLQYPNTLIPGTASAYWGSEGQTMAEVRFARAALTAPSPTPEPRLSPNLNRTDYWTDSVNGTPDPDPLDPADLPLIYSYADLDPSIPRPTNGAVPCDEPFYAQPANFNCRVTINYVEHIHPLWALPRTIPDPVDPINNPPIDVTCTNCHGPRLDVNNDPILPDGQLELVGGLSIDNANHLVSYRELLFDDSLQVLAGNVGAQIIVDDLNVTVSPSISTAGARSSRFVEKLFDEDLPEVAGAPAGTSHAGFMSKAELKLITEWIDIGGQYFNNPFDPAAPQN